MLKLFKSNNPAVGIYLFIYTLILTFPAFLLTDVHYETPEEPFSRGILQLAMNIFGDGGLASRILAAVLILVQAALMKNLATKYKLFEQPTYMLPLFYVLTACLFMQFIQFSPPLMAGTVIILFLNKAFESLHREKAFLLVFDMGFLAAIAALFYFPAIVLLPVLFISLVVIRPFIIREWLLAAAGFLTPFFLVTTYYFWYGKVIWFYNSYFLNAFAGGQNNFSLTLEVALFGGLILLIILGSLFLLQLNYMRSSIQFRKYSTIIMWMLFALSFCYLLQPFLRLEHFIIIAVPVSFMLTYFFLNLKHARLAETLHIIVFLLVIFFHYRLLFF